MLLDVRNEELGRATNVGLTFSQKCQHVLHKSHTEQADEHGGTRVIITQLKNRLLLTS